MSEATSTLINENEDCDGGSGATQPSTFESASINQTVVSSDNVTYSDSPKSTSVLKRISRFLTVEPMLFLHMLAWSSLGVNTQYFYIERICQREFPDMDCKNMTANETAEAHVHGIAAYYSTYRNLIEAGLPVIFSLFIGPWSDKHGSKTPMILSLIGYITSSILLYLFAMPKYLDPSLLLVSSIPLALCGGVIGLLLSAFRYVAAASSTKDRSFRMAFAEGSWFLGSPVGLLGSASLQKYGGYQLVFLTCTILFSASAVYCLFFVKSDKPETDLVSSNSSFLKDMFNVEAVKETILTAFRKRSGSQRMWILLLVGTSYLRVFTLYGNIFITVLYTQEKFLWDASKYSIYTTYDGMIGLTGSATMAIFGMKIYKIRDSAIGLLSSISCLFGVIVFVISSFATFGWMMYLGATVQMFCGLISIITRSMISKLVHKDEVGKIYSFVASGEAAIPLFAAPFYNTVYAATETSAPGAGYMVTTFLNGFIVISFIYFCSSSWNSTITQHERLDEDMEEEEQREVDAHGGN